jgi:hypothetical protein
MDGPSTGPDAPGAAPRGLWAVGVLEAVSLAVLLVNLAVAHNPAVAQATWPVHGLLYLTGIALVWGNRLPRLSKVLVLLPAVGTLLAARHHASFVLGRTPR